jgi:mRNA interferase MazF
MSSSPITSAQAARPRPTPSVARVAPAPASASAAATPSQETRYARGDIWLVAENPTQPPVGTELWSNRPAIIVSNNVTGNHSGFVQVVYLTTSARKRSGPTHIMVPAPMTGRNQPDAEAMVLCEQIHTVDVSRLRKPLGTLSRNRMHEIDQAIALTLSIGRNPDSYALFKKWEKYIQVHGIDMAGEIQALAGHTTDQRVEALTRALALVTSQRDSYKALFETDQQMPEALHLVQDLVTAPLDVVAAAPRAQQA